MANEKAQFVEIVRTFLDDQKNIYGSLTPEFSELLSHLNGNLLRGGKWHRL
jgi:hypothetical protein